VETNCTDKILRLANLIACGALLAGAVLVKLSISFSGYATTIKNGEVAYSGF